MPGDFSHKRLNGAGLVRRLPAICVKSSRAATSRPGESRGYDQGIASRFVTTPVLASASRNRREPAQIAIVRCGGINKFLRGADAVFLQHHHKQLRVDHRAGVEKFHGKN